MSEDIIDDFDVGELYTEKQYRLEEQDLRILKGLLSDKDAARDFVSMYDDSLFIGDAKPFARCALSYIKTYKDIPTKRVMLELADSSLVNDFEYIFTQLDQLQPNSGEFRYDLDKIKERFAKDKIETLKTHINSIDLENDIDWEITLQKFRKQIDDADSIRKGQKPAYLQKTLREYLPEFKEDFARKVKDPTLGQGILTGYSFLDYVSNGLRGSQLLIIGGESSSGKSFFLNNMAIQMWMQKNTICDTKSTFGKGYNILYFSLEMPYSACFRRTMARLADLPIYGLRDCKIPANKIDQLNRAAKFIHNYPFDFEIVDIPRGVTIEQIEDRFLESRAKGRSPEVVVVDYLGLMENYNSEGDDWLKLGDIAGQLHEFARVYNIVVLSAVQLNRPPKNVKDSAELIGMHRIGRSSLIIHHADFGIQIETRKDETHYSDLIYHLIKVRDGELGKHTILKNFKNGTLKDMEDNPYIPPEEDDLSFNAATSLHSDEDISARLAKLGWYDSNDSSSVDILEEIKQEQNLIPEEEIIMEEDEEGDNYANL